MTVPFERADTVATPSLWDPSLLRRLRVATCSPMMVDILNRDWPYLSGRGGVLRECQAVRVYPEQGRGFVLDYEMRWLADDGERVERVFGELVGEGAETRHAELLGKLRKRRRGQLPRSASTDRVTYLPTPGLVLRVAGLDDKLLGLKPALDPVVMMPILSRHLSLEPGEGPGCAIALLGHRPGKRCVVRYRVDGRDPKSGCRLSRSVIGKVYRFRDDRGRRVFDAMQGLWDRGFGDGTEDGIRVPRPLAYLPEWQLLLLEDAPGSPLSELDGWAIEPGVEAAGRALAKLHACPLKVTGAHTAEDEFALVKGWVTIVSQVYPESKAEFDDALARVRDALDQCRSFEPTLVHRDFYEKQVLANGTQTILIDFDTLCLADPAIDVGNFLAHLTLAGLQGRQGVERLGEAFLAGYRLPSSGALLARVEAYTQSSLLRLAALYRFPPRWSHIAGPLLQALAEVRIAGRGFPAGPGHQVRAT